MSWELHQEITGEPVKLVFYKFTKPSFDRC